MKSRTAVVLPIGTPLYVFSVGAIVRGLPHGIKFVGGFCFYQVAGVSSGTFHFGRSVIDRELSIFVDEAGEITETDAKVFGTNRTAFRKNHMKHIHKKSMV